MNTNWNCTNCFAQVQATPHKTTFLMTKRVFCPSCKKEFEAPSGTAVRVALWTGFVLSAGVMISGYSALHGFASKQGREPISFGQFLANGGWFYAALLGLIFLAIVKDLLLISDRNQARKQTPANLVQEPSAPVVSDQGPMSASTDARSIPAALVARREKKNHFVGGGCAVQTIALAVPFLWYWMFGTNLLLAGLILSIFLFVVGRKHSYTWHCGNCKAALPNEDIPVCPQCNANLQ